VFDETIEAVATVMPLLAQAGDSEILTESRSYIVDVAIVAALFGLALFMVCRSSRRV
jgi:hypothetical protein